MLSHRTLALLLVGAPAWTALAAAGGGDPYPAHNAPKSGDSSCTAFWQDSLLAGGAPNQAITSLAEFDDGTGPALYAGGWFTEVGGQPISRVARWDGFQWSPLGSGLNAITVSALAVFDDGTGPALYVGGSFSSAGGVPAANIARWDGHEWSALGAGTNLLVSSLAVYDDGSGPALFVAGGFTLAGGLPAARIARWDGTSWSALGTGLDSYPRALAVHDDGSGSALFVAGDFFLAGGVPTSRVARWDGFSWSAVGAGVDDRAFAITEFDRGLGAGPELVIGGLFLEAGGKPAARIARWDGSDWSSLGDGLDDWVTSLAVYDDGSGEALYAGGWFTGSGNLTALRVARWDGLAWGPLGSGVSDSVNALASLDHGPAQGLWVGGRFTSSPAGGAYLAHWSCPPTPAPSEVWGCVAKPAALLAVTPQLEIETTFELALTNPSVDLGLGFLLLGDLAVDPTGCGTNLPGLGELLLAPFPAPALISTVAMVEGAGSFALNVPSKPSLVGQELALQAATLHLEPEGTVLGASGALVATVAP